MKLSKHGKNISKAEIQGITPLGLWLLIKEKEYFLPFSAFPWFRKASVSDISAVQLLHEQHIYWPKLDIDLALDSIENLEKYPLISSAEISSAKKQLRPAA